MLRPLAGALFGFLLVAGMQRAIGHTSFSPRDNVLDYRVVACGERAMLRGGDPYRIEPLRTCEHAFGLAASEPAWAATPFCLPPYTAALLAPFAVLDPQLGRTLWFLLIVLATCVTGIALAKILNRSAFAVTLVLAPTVGLLNLHYGETVPFAITAVALAALAVQRRAPVTAALAAAAALLEPAIGLPAVVGMFVLVPKTRGMLLVFAGILGAFSVVAFGFARNLEYLVAFLPAHEAAELLARDQYSLTHLAFLAGASPQLAARLGSMSYVLAIATGVISARRVGTRMSLPALFVLLPVGVSMLGGPFVHDVEIAAALPAALLLARDSWLARCTVAFLAVDWTEALRRAVVPVVGAAAGAALLFVKGKPQHRMLYVLVAAVTVLGLHALLPQSPSYVSIIRGQPEPAISAHALTPVAWGWRIRLDASLNRVALADQLRKVPTWFALALLPLALSPFALRGRELRQAYPLRRSPVPSTLRTVELAPRRVRGRAQRGTRAHGKGSSEAAGASGASALRSGEPDSTS